MTEFLLVSALFVLAMVGLGLVRVLRGTSEADSLMAAQLLAALLLLGAATGASSVIDVALILALLAAFASFAFVKAKDAKATSASAGDAPGDAP